jgi:2-octaprenyl-6-methoxyphenol hydroxylase
LDNNYDIAIIGGGMAGASLACSLAGQSLRIAVIEQVAPDADDQPSYDDRGLALSLSSQRILNAIDVWPDVAARSVPIRHIHISEKGRFGQVRLHAADLGLAALGHVVMARDLGTALLRKTTSRANTDYICPASVTDIRNTGPVIEVDYRLNEQTTTIRCRLLVGADGTGSAIRAKLGIETSVKDYGQTAIVSNVTPSLSHNNTAYERFTTQGPIAMLPVTEDRCVAVHIVASRLRDHYLSLNDSAYLDTVQQDFGNRLGRMLRTGRRKSYPIRLVKANRQYADRAVLLGNSVHTIHPNGAQGFNLGLRDTAALAEHISEAVQAGNDPGSRHLLESYMHSRLQDQTRVVRFSDTIAAMFYNDNPVKSLTRNLGMLALDLSLPLKRRLVREASGLAGRQASQVRQGLDRLA